MMFLLAHEAYSVASGRKQKRPTGLYTQRMLLYKALAVKEGIVEADVDPQVTAKMDLPHLFLRMRRGCMSVNYSRLCSMLRAYDRVALYAGCDEDAGAVYVIWGMELNAMSDENENEDENKEEDENDEAEQG